MSSFSWTHTAGAGAKRRTSMVSRSRRFSCSRGGHYYADRDHLSHMSTAERLATGDAGIVRPMRHVEVEVDGPEGATSGIR